METIGKTHGIQGALEMRAVFMRRAYCKGTGDPLGKCFAAKPREGRPKKP